MNKNQLLFLTILVEGYVVLAAELLAIRTLIPFVGSGTEVISIIISAVLLPLAVGYHVGGQRFQKAKLRRQGRVVSLRKILLSNLLNALIPLVFGLSYMIQEIFFALLTGAGITHHIAQAAVFCVVFLVYPVFLLAQTIPLLSNYFSKNHLSAITGRMLFFSTLGSFGGSVISTIVLMTTIGVHYTLVFTLGLLVLLIFLLTRRWYNADNVIALFFWVVALLMNNHLMLKELNIVANNSYSMVSIYKDEQSDRTIMDINRSMSSAYAKDPKQRFEYLRWIEENLINPAMASGQPRKFLIIGAGGFTMGVDDEFNEYTFVDIDASLKGISEQYLLPKPLGKNKQFVPLSARAFLTRDTGKYDVVILDAFTNMRSIPMEVTTREFLEECKNHLKPQGVLVSNVAGSPTFDDRFMVRYTNTFRSVFPFFTSQLCHPLELWKKDGRTADNILYIYHHRPQYHEDTGVYTDDKNTYSLDR